MRRNLKFFYFGYQCPHNTYLLARIKTLAWKESVPLHLFDVAEEASVCEDYCIFVPTMLVVNDDQRWCGPFSKEDVLAMLNDEEFTPATFPWHGPGEPVEGDLLKITPESVLSTCKPCLGTDDIGLCRGKSEWVHDMLERKNVDHLGYLHLHDGRCVGGAEFLPSQIVPYPIPGKSEKDAFLTCSYASHGEHDYRTHPLKRLIEDLRDTEYDALSVAAAKEGVYPNGPVAWLEGLGFEDRGRLSAEELQRIEIRHLQLQL
ncbi:MAG: hypothetical protein JSV90_02085 [Methanobacteriota archaeon]|nr:MAG: hypothetical protein JSV90_02085 [Euryarchaeota archaeon]